MKNEVGLTRHCKFMIWTHNPGKLRICLFIWCTDTHRVMMLASMVHAHVSNVQRQKSLSSSKHLQFLNTVFEVMLKQISRDFNCSDCCIHPYVAHFGGHPTRCTRWEINESCYIGWPSWGCNSCRPTMNDSSPKTEVLGSAPFLISGWRFRHTLFFLNHLWSWA